MKNTLKAKLREGKSTVGLWMSIPSPDVSEALSTLPFDWFLFDMEHSALNEQSAQVLMQGMRGDLITPLIRVAWNDQVLIKKALDIGAHGVIVPMVNTRQDAEKAVSACKYPPVGNRGYGPKRPWVYDPHYFDNADEEVLVIVQIETGEAVENVEEILSVDGVDGCFIGPFDLSVSMGFKGQMDDPSFQKAVDTVFAAGKRLGVATGMWGGAGKRVAERLADGWQIVAVGLDLYVLVAGAKRVLEEALG